MKILHVEERLSLTNQLKEILTDLGYEYLPATSFEEAEKLLHELEFRIDILIVDLNMPYDELVSDVDDMTTNTKYGMISGFLWLNKILIDSAINKIDPNKCIIFSGYLDVLTEDQKKELSGVRLISKSSLSAEPTKALIAYIENLKIKS